MMRPEIMKALAKKSLAEIDTDFGYYAGYRAAQAKGVLCRGWFTAGDEAGSLTRAAHFQPGEATPVTARFSNFTSNPIRHDGQLDVRGMATAFHLRDGSQTDITALRMKRFFVGNARQFVWWQRTMRRGRGDLPMPGRWTIPYWFKKVPPWIGVRQITPLCRIDSYTGCTYNALHAFRWLNGDGQEYVRYTWVPEMTERPMRPWQPRWWRSAHRPDPDFLRADLAARLEQWPVRFRLEVQLAENEDSIDDASKIWSKDGRRITVGTLALTEMGSWDFNGSEPLRFDPTRMTDGIEIPEGDSLLMLRKRVYEMSAERRNKGTRVRDEPLAELARPVMQPLPLDPNKRKRVNEEDEIDICFDTSAGEPERPLLLIMGFACPMTWWHRDFCAMLEEKGFYLIRFDNRDSGNSTHVDANVGKIRSPLRAFLGLGAPYTIEDMADDAAGLLRELDVESAHVMGISLGGMVAQALAIRHPDRVLSLTSINSCPKTRKWPPSRLPTRKVAGRLLRAQPTESLTQWVRYSMPLWRLMAGRSFPRAEEEHVRGLLNLQWAWSGGVDPDGDLRQLLAVVAARDRTADLRELRIPAAVIYGSEDPFVRPAGGEDTINAIEGARGVRIEGMGHYTPRWTWPIVVEAVDRVAQQAEARAGEPRQPAPAEPAPER